MTHETVRAFPEQDLRGRSGLLETCGRVDRVTGDEALAGGRVAGDDLTCVDPGPVSNGDPPTFLELVVESSEMVAHLTGGANRTQRIVLVHARQPEDGHDRVADVLLDKASVALERGSHLVEVPRHHLTDGFGIELLAHGRRALEVGEDDGHGLP